MIKKKTSIPTIIPIILLVLTFVISMIVTIRSKDNLDVRSRASGTNYADTPDADTCESGHLMEMPDGCSDYVIQRRGDCREGLIAGIGIEGCSEYNKYVKEKAPITIKERVCYAYPSFPGCQ